MGNLHKNIIVLDHHYLSCNIYDCPLKKSHENVQIYSNQRFIFWVQLLRIPPAQKRCNPNANQPAVLSDEK